MTDPVHTSAQNRLQVPVTVMLERRMVSRGKWTAPSWYLNGVAVGAQLLHRPAPGQRIAETDNGELFCWSDFAITFYKDACERYWHALIGDKPLVYVVCKDELETDDTDHGLPVEPLLVTCDYDEATAHAETDALVLSCSIPAELYRYMESFVLEHYKPQPFKKRKRKKWKSEASSGVQP